MRFVQSDVTPALTQSSSTQTNAAHAFRNLCDPTSIVTHICEFPLLTDHLLGAETVLTENFNSHTYTVAAFYDRIFRIFCPCCFLATNQPDSCRKY